MIHFTADTHFNHANIIKYCKRPFDSAEHMNSVLIENWNKQVKKNDTVYHLGDFGFFNSLEELKRFRNKLNGRIVLIVGNHDNRKWCEEVFERVYDQYYLKVENHRFMLNHYAMATWKGSHYGTYHTFGHSHGTYLPCFEGKLAIDSGVDNWNFNLVSLTKMCAAMDVLKRIAKNPNWTENLKGAPDEWKWDADVYFALKEEQMEILDNA